MLVLTWSVISIRGLHISSKANRAFMFTFRETEGLPGMTWCLRFAVETFADWKDRFTIHLWEGKNATSYAKAKGEEQRYIQDAYGDVNMDAAEEGDGAGDDAASEDEEQLSDREDTPANDGEDDEASSSDSEAFARGARNQQLAVGFKDDLSYVTRGDMIGVFAHKNDRLRFRTAIDRVKDMDGKAFSPNKVNDPCLTIFVH